MRISDWSSDVCSSDLRCTVEAYPQADRWSPAVLGHVPGTERPQRDGLLHGETGRLVDGRPLRGHERSLRPVGIAAATGRCGNAVPAHAGRAREAYPLAPAGPRTTGSAHVRTPVTNA